MGNDGSPHFDLRRPSRHGFTASRMPVSRLFAPNRNRWLFRLLNENATCRVLIYSPGAIAGRESRRGWHVEAQYHGGHGFAMPRVLTRCARTALSVQRPRRAEEIWELA